MTIGVFAGGCCLWGEKCWALIEPLFDDLLDSDGFFEITFLLFKEFEEEVEVDLDVAVEDAIDDWMGGGTVNDIVALSNSNEDLGDAELGWFEVENRFDSNEVDANDIRLVDLGKKPLFFEVTCFFSDCTDGFSKSIEVGGISEWVEDFDIADFFLLEWIQFVDTVGLNLSEIFGWGWWFPFASWWRVGVLSVDSGARWNNRVFDASVDFSCLVIFSLL